MEKKVFYSVMEREIYIAAIKQVNEDGHLYMTSHPVEKCVIGTYASLSYARKKAAPYRGYVVRVYPNGFRVIYMN